MKKRIKSQIKTIRHSSEKSKFSFGMLALMIFCLVLIVVSTFSQLSFSHYIIPMKEILHPITYLSDSSNHFMKIKSCEYIPQIPIVMFVAALLGPIYALIVVFLYILMGLTFLPIFALGGGPRYIFQYSFGYILAYLPAVFIACKNISKKFSYKSITKAAIYGVITIHIIGVFYVIISAMIKREPYEFILDWLYAQTVTKIIYDFIFSFFAIMLARGTRKILWIILG